VQALLERVNEWAYELSKVLEGQLEAGSAAALLVVFAAGVLTSFTPCVYPMIPVTVTFIGGSAAGKRSRAVRLSLVYVLGMTLVYSALGMITALLGKTFGSFTHNAWVYGAVGALILLFGVFMLDVLTLPVPRFFTGVQTAGARRGGYGGAFLIGLAAGFVAAPCTGPVMALLLVYVGRTQNVLWGGTLLFVFAVGLGLLLLLVGIFSGLLTTLPRAGIWMKWIKNGFGIGMLAIGVWFIYKAVALAL
jgi:thiol:disulfide interchange protein DsbD